MLPLLPIVLGLTQFAPTLLRYFGAGQATQNMVDKVVGIAQVVTGAATPQEALAAIQADSAKQAAFQAHVLVLDAELEQAYLADRADARKRDIVYLQTGRENIRADVMVAVDAIGLICCLVVLGVFRKDLPAESITLLTTIASLFGLCLRDAHQFEFGSSRGSRNKDALMAQGSNQAAPAAGATAP